MARFTTNVALLENASATGSEFTIDQGGRFLFLALGTFGGATVKLQIKGPDDSTFVDVPDSSLTAAGSKTVYLPDNAVVKAAIASGPPSGIYASLRRCPEC